MSRYSKISVNDKTWLHDNESEPANQVFTLYSLEPVTGEEQGATEKDHWGVVGILHSGQGLLLYRAKSKQTASKVYDDLIKQLDAACAA